MLGPLQFLLDGCPGQFPCIYFLIAIFYLVLAGFTCRGLRRRLQIEYWNQYNVVLLSTFLFCTFRGVILLLWPSMDLDTSMGAWIAVFDIPNLLYYLTYTFVLVIWAEFTWGIAPRRVMILKHISPRLLFACFSSLFVISTPLMWILSGHDDSSVMGKSLSVILAILMNLVAATGFVIMGRPFYRKVVKLMNRHPVENEKYVAKKKRQMIWFTIATAMSFIGIAALQAMSGRVTKSLDWKENVFLFLIVFAKELMVVATMQWMLDGIPPKADKIQVPVPPPPKEGKKNKESKQQEGKSDAKAEAVDEGDAGSEQGLLPEPDHKFVAPSFVNKDPNPPQGTELQPVRK